MNLQGLDLQTSRYPLQRKPLCHFLDTSRFAVLARILCGRYNFSVNTVIVGGGFITVSLLCGECLQIYQHIPHKIQAHAVIC